jgi:hypothetical protein
MDGIADLSFCGLVGYLLGAYFLPIIKQYVPDADMKEAAILGAVAGMALQRVFEGIARGVYGAVGRKFRHFERIVEVLLALRRGMIRRPEAAKYVRKIKESYFVGGLETAVAKEK